MKIALIDIKGDDARKISTNSSVNIRNMSILAKEIGADFYYNTALLRKKKYDAIIFGFGSIASEIEKTKKFVRESGAKKIFWLVGEYEQSMNPPLYYVCRDLDLKFTTLQNFDLKAKKFGKFCKDQIFININLLIARKPNKMTPKKYDCLYYGRWRPDRADYFKKYLTGEIFLSTDLKNMKKYKRVGCSPRYIKKLSWVAGGETLNHFRYSLYIEDKYTHKNFNNLANRYYEAGFCNNIVLFDKSTKNTILKSELGRFIDQVEQFIVKDKKDLDKKIKKFNQDFERYLAIQKSWRVSQDILRRAEIDKIKEAIE